MTEITVGADLIEIARVRAALEGGAPRLAERLFTRDEWTYCQMQSQPWASLAVRFAAKEAVRKIFGQWGIEGVVWRETEVVTNDRGAPALRLHGTALQQAGSARFALSLSHTDELAQAFCVAWQDETHE